MKTLKLNSEKVVITREVISKFGETVYHSPNVDSVVIKINFKDGSSIGFKRSEIKDEIDRSIEECEDD